MVNNLLLSELLDLIMSSAIHVLLVHNHARKWKEFQ